MEKKERCSFHGGMTILPDGMNELDPCVYELKEIHRNVDIEICQCKVCGHIEINWFRTPDTEDEVLGDLK